MELVIKHVQARGFKAITDSKLFELYPHTIVSGENSQGKTTIGDAIAYCLYGCNLAGNNKTDNLLHKGASEMYVGVTAQIDGLDHVITRHRKGNTTTVTVDNRKINQDELARMLPSKQVFLSIFCPEYFLNLSEADSRALIGGYLQPISRDEILNSLTPYEADLLKKQPFLDVNVYLSELKTELKLRETDITKEEGALEQYQQDLFQAQQETQQEVPVVQDSLLAAEQELHRIAEQKQAEEQALLQEKEQLLEQKSALWREIPEQKTVPTLDEIMQPVVKPELLNTRALEEKLSLMRTEWRYSKGQLEDVETLKPGAVCPKCLQEVDEEHIKHMKQELQEELEEINAGAQSYKQELERLQQMNQEQQKVYEKAVEEERNRAQLVIQQIQLENDAIRKQYQESNAAKESELRNAVLQMDRKILLHQDECKLKETEQEKIVLELREQVKQAELHNNNCQHLARRILELTQKIAQITENISDYTAEKQQLLQMISAAKAFALKQVELQAAQLAPYMQHVEIRLKEIVKTTGESKDCFKVTYDGKLTNQLSASEKIKAGLEVSQLLKQLSGCVVPVFVDNAESITSSVKSDAGQCIECRVVSGQPLMIQEG